MSLTRKQVNNRLISDQLLAFEPLNTTDADPRVITYQFADSTQPIDLWNTYTGWTALSSAEENAVRAALAQFEDIMNVTFVETQNALDPDLNLGKASLSGNTAGLGGWQFFYNGFGQITEFDGFAVFDNNIDLTEDPALVLHEIGHAFGLKHPATIFCVSWMRQWPKCGTTYLFRFFVYVKLTTCAFTKRRFLLGSSSMQN